jgi:alpha-aminoadipate carrier protein LysW
MAICSECEADIDVDEFDVDRGDQLSCVECGASLMVSGVSPLTLALADEETAGDVHELADEDRDDDANGPGQ